MKAGIEAQRAANPRVPSEFWDQLAVRIQRDSARLIEILVPLYAAHFSIEQLRELVTFYGSPLGRHLVEVQPTITAQSMQAGQQWGAQLAAEISQDIVHRRTPTRAP